MSERYRDQVVVITGGGRGIGRAIALEFAAEGATLVLAGRRMDALENAAEECRELGGAASTAHCDVMKDEDLASLVGHTMNAHRRIDVLVNNAGVVTGGRLDEIASDDISRMVGVNVWAPIRLTQLALPHMREAGRGAIVNISSLAGRLGVPYYATYCASKFAMRGFSESLRRELKPEGIHVMAVYPGGTATDMMETVEFDRLGMTVATAGQVARAVMRGLRWSQGDVYVGVGESILSRFNDVMPWAAEIGVELVRGQFRDAVANQRTT